jgi:quercetin dioxygenase-like cupin family protein
MHGEERAAAAVRTSGPAWWFLDCLLVERSAIGGAPVVSEMVLPEGASPPFHVHAHLDDSFYVLGGTMVVRCADDVQLATAGAWVPFPMGVPHTFRVVGGPARVLAVHADDGFLQLVRRLGRPAPEPLLPAATGGPGMKGLNEAMAGHGILNVGPSMSEEEAQAFLGGLAT